MKRAALATLLFAVSSAASAKDIAGAQDYPLLPRMPHFYITQHDTEDEVDRAFGGEEQHGFLHTISYRLEEHQDVPQADTILGFYSDAIGGLGGKRTAHGDTWAAFRFTHEKTDVWVELKCEVGEPVYELYVLEKMPPMEDRMEAAAIAKNLALYGHAAVYGLTFDYEKRELAPDAGGQLAEVAKTLETQPGLALLIVGHVADELDMRVAAQKSQQWADAVAKSLEEKHEIPASRLKAVGAASTAPIVSNASAAGRRRNTRIELVVAPG